MKSDLEIAQEAHLEPISKIAGDLGLLEDEVELYGKYKAKVSLEVLDRLKDKPSGKFIVVTGMTPTPLGEGKTLTTVGLAQALNRIGKRTIACIRQPSLGPTFGIKGGAAGGGYSQVVPMEDFNLHLTGDTHAVSMAHNLLAAMIDNHLNHGNATRHRPLLDQLAPRRRHLRPRPAQRRRSVSAARRTVSRARRTSISPSPLRSWPYSASRPVWPTCASASAASLSAPATTASP